MQANISHNPDVKFEVVSILHRMSNTGYDEATDRFRPADVSSKMYAEMFMLTEQERLKLFAPVIDLYQYVAQRLDISRADMDNYYSLLPVCQKSVAELLLFAEIMAERSTEIRTQEQKLRLLAELLVSDLSHQDLRFDSVVPQNEAEMLRYLERTACGREEAYKILNMFARYSEHVKRINMDAAKATDLYLKKASVTIPQFERCRRRLKDGISKDTHPIVRHAMVRDSIESYVIIPSIIGYSFVRVMAYEEGYLNRKYNIALKDYVRYGMLVDTLSDYKETKRREQRRMIQSIRSLGDKNRLLIIDALNRRPMFGRELASLTGLTPATVSHHIKALVANGFVDVEKHSTSSLFLINRANLRDLITQLETQLKANFF